MRCGKAFQRGLVEVIGVDGDLGGLGARLNDFGERSLLMGGVALDRVDEVGDQIRAPLVLVFDLSPGALHVLVELNHSVVSTREKSVESDEHYGHDGDPKGGLTDDG